MLVPAIRKSVPYNLRRFVACAACGGKTRTRVARPNPLPASLPSFAVSRTYSTDSPHISLPMLVAGAPVYSPSFLTPLKLLYLTLFKIIPHIDKEFDISEFLKGARYASSLISKALANKDFESLRGLVAEDTIETLKERIEIYSPNQRQLIALDESDMLFYILSNIEATTGTEHSIEITIACHYIPGFEEKKKDGTNFLEFTTSVGHLVCNYIFIRKYVDNTGGPWIVTFVNHYTVSL